MKPSLSNRGKQFL